MIQPVDPKAETLTSRLVELNRVTALDLFKELALALFEMIKRTVDRFEKEKTIKYLKDDYLALVNRCCKTNSFKWKAKSPKSRSLWQRLIEEVRSLLRSTIGFLRKYLEFKELPEEIQLDRAMACFLDVFKMEKDRL